MKYSLYIVSIAFCLMAGGCAKDNLHIVESGAVRFNVSAEIGERDILLQAGHEGYYMQTSYMDTSTSEPGAFVGVLMHLSELHGHEKLEFRIRNYRIGIPASGDILTAIQAGSLDYYFVKVSPNYSVKFDPLFSDTAKAVSWDFGDGTNSTEITPIHVYREDGITSYRVCLSVSYNPSCGDEICSEVFMPDASCTSEISVEKVSPTEFIYRATATGRKAIQYSWELENNVLVNSSEIKYSYNSSSSLVEYLRLHTVDATGCTTDVAYKNPVGNPTQCYSNFSYTVTSFYGQDPGFSTIEVLYTTDEGKMYYSSLGPQGDESGFGILNYAEYIKNQQEQLTLEMEIEFNCTLYAADGSILQLKDGKGRIAVAHP